MTIGLNGLPLGTAEAVARAIGNMPVAHGRAFAAAIAAFPVWSGSVEGAALSAVAAPAYREPAAALLAAWKLEPNVSGLVIATAAMAAIAARDTERRHQMVDVVATGPASAHVSVRQTRAVMLDLIAQAERELLIVSFAAYKVADVSEALHHAADRRVTIRMVLESVDESDGALKFDASKAFSSVRQHVQFYVWPADRRPDGISAALHAKAVVADDSAAFVSSANLTESALDHNLELGLLVRGGSVPSRIRDHFRALIAAGILRLT